MQQLLDWLKPYLTQLEALPNVGDDALISIGTVLAAILATLAAIFGWYFTALRERRLERLQRQRASDDLVTQREERIDDIVRALHAEILAGIVQSERQITEKEIKYAISDPSPFATPDETDFVFASIKDELSILPSKVIHDVVCYYRVALQTNLMVKDFRSEDFKNQNLHEKHAFMEGFMILMQVLRDRGHVTLAKLEDYGDDREFGKVLRNARQQVEERTRTSTKLVTEIIDKLRPPAHPET